MAKIVRLFAYLFHLILALYLFGISVVALSSHNNLHMDYLPWSGASLTTWLIAGAVIAIISIALAITGIFPYLFPLWAFTVLALMVRGFIIKPYAFEGGKPEFQQVLIIIGIAFLAFLASLTLLIRPKRKA